MGIEVIARGWDRPDWCGEFYPEGLPDDWRLTYFAHDFESVLIPATVWHHAPPERLAQWAEEVPDRFRFYLEFDNVDDLNVDDLRGWRNPPRAPTPGREGAEPGLKQQSRTPEGDDTPVLARAAAALGHRFAGSVAGLPLSALPAGPQPGSGTAPIRAPVARDAEGRAMLARQVPASIVADPRAALPWLTALAAEAGARPALAVLENASPEVLTRWCHLVVLAGFA